MTKADIYTQSTRERTSLVLSSRCRLDTVPHIKHKEHHMSVITAEDMAATVDPARDDYDICYKVWCKIVPDWVCHYSGYNGARFCQNNGIATEVFRYRVSEGRGYVMRHHDHGSPYGLTGPTPYGGPVKADLVRALTGKASRPSDTYAVSSLLLYAFSLMTKDELSALPMLAPLFYGSELWREAMEKKSKEKVVAA